MKMNQAKAGEMKLIDDPFGVMSRSQGMGGNGFSSVPFLIDGNLIHGISTENGILFTNHLS